MCKQTGIQKIIKRSGVVVPFDGNKIKIAVGKAFAEVYGTNKDYTLNIENVYADVMRALEKSAFKSEYPSVEEVQDKVQEALAKVDITVLLNFHAYRLKQAQKRRDEIIYEEAFNVIDNYIGEDDWEVKENSNMGYSVQGLNNYISSNISKKYWMGRVYNAEVKKAIEKNLMHVHDLNLIAPYCCGWDLEQLLVDGFKGAAQKTVSGPARHFSTILGQMYNFLYTLQGESAGAQAFSSVDTYLAPFIAEDNLTYEEVKREVRSFIYNLNVPTRVGFQSPFTNVTLDLVVPEHMKNQPTIINGKNTEHTYGEYQKEMDMFNKAFCEVMLEGDFNGNQFPYPIPTYNITSEFNWDSEISNLIFEMTAKYGIPYFANFINSDMKPEDVRSMCCRLRLSLKELRKKGGGMFGANPKTGSIGVVTVNLPLIAYLTKGDKEAFKQLLRETMDIAKRSLDTKREFLEKMTTKGLYPYIKFYMQSVKDGKGGYWANHFSTIGLVGMNECIANFTNGIDNITTEYGQEFAIEVMNYMRSVLEEYQVNSKEKVMYNLEATPAEGTSYRLARIDKERHSDIITAGIDNPYYTNSTQLPVDYTTDIFEAMKLQEDIQVLYTGGTVFHGMLGESLPNGEAAKKLVKSMLMNTQMPYITVSPTFSICRQHGYIKGEAFDCPICGEPAEVYARVVGFYRPVRNWNIGKAEEYKCRKEFIVD